jgi:PiT family inorganic phosphate transporter
MLGALQPVLAAALAYANGANDNSKGVATLLGTGTADYRRALAWAAVTTFAGSLAALALASKLVAAFTGKDLVPDALVQAPGFGAAVTCGAALTVLLATVLGFPISTTHALTGALVGAGLAAGSVDLGVLGTSFFLPLLSSPLAAIVLTVPAYVLLRELRVRLGVSSETCVCVGQAEPIWVPVQGLVQADVASGSLPVLSMCRTHGQRYRGSVLGLSAQQLLDGLHYLTAGAIGFARGLNDTPKILALLLISGALAPQLGLLLVASAMAAGGLLQARKVARTMSERITSMNPGQGFTANLITAVLVIGASRFGLPVSTTHVSCGALFGIGAVTGEARWRVIASILLAWVTTLPTAVALAAAAYFLFRLGAG